MLLDQYGAADVVIPEVMLRRQWPDGPVTGTFFARHGPDHKLLGRFTLSTTRGDREGLAALLDKGVERIDAIYIDALRSGRLASDPSLDIEEEEPLPEDALTLEEIIAETVSDIGVSTFTVQADTPDAAALNMVETALRAIPGVRSSGTTSLALGGLSVIRVRYAGGIDQLRSSLAAAGWTVEAGADTLRIRRAPTSPPPTP